MGKPFHSYFEEYVILLEHFCSNKAHNLSPLPKGTKTSFGKKTGRVTVVRFHTSVAKRRQLLLFSAL